MLDFIVNKCKFITLNQLNFLVGETLAIELIRNYNGKNVYYSYLTDEILSPYDILGSGISLDDKNYILLVDESIVNDIHFKYIDSIHAYVSFVNGLYLQSSNEVSYDSNEVTYRGHSSVDYISIPSLFRDIKNYKLENDFIYSKLRNNHEEYYKYTSNIDIIKHIQHYYTGTRVMDLTKDPLMALFFAVEQNFDKDAEVVIYSIENEEIKYDNSDSVTILATLSRLPFKDKLDVEKLLSFNEKEFEYKDLSSFIKNLPYNNKIDQHEIELYIEHIEKINKDIENFNSNKAIRKLAHEVRKERAHFTNRINPHTLIHPIFTKASWDNERISSQSGVFFLASLAKYKDFEDLEQLSKVTGHSFKSEELTLLNNQLNFISYTNERRNIYGKYLITFIPKNKKESIKRALENLNINKARVYPNLDKIAEYYMGI